MTDLGLIGDGTARQRWINYRDAVVYNNVVDRSPLFPITGLMLHGIVAGMVGESHARGLDVIPSVNDFAHEVRLGMQQCLCDCLCGWYCDTLSKRAKQQRRELALSPLAHLTIVVIGCKRWYSLGVHLLWDGYIFARAILFTRAGHACRMGCDCSRRPLGSSSLTSS